MKLGWQPDKWLRKKARLGRRGYPIRTVAFYGPDDRRATKVVAATFHADAPAEPTDMRRWSVEKGDARDDWILGEVGAYLRDQGVRSVAMVDKIIGCPHEEGVDYPSGSDCPECPYWAGRDRWADKADAG